MKGCYTICTFCVILLILQKLHNGLTLFIQLSISKQPKSEANLEGRFSLLKILFPLNELRLVLFYHSEARNSISKGTSYFVGFQIVLNYTKR